MERKTAYVKPLTEGLEINTEVFMAGWDTTDEQLGKGMKPDFEEEDDDILPSQRRLWDTEDGQ